MKIDIAQALLKIEAVRLRPQQPFTWSSGWKSPIYCDNRLTLSYVSTRNLIKNGLVSLVQKYFPEAESIAGVATAGIAQGALMADELALPYLYVRPKPKDHGMENLIEGKITKGQKVVVVEDLISTGGSSLKAVQALREAGFEVIGMVAIFTYGFALADEQFKAAQVTLQTLSDYATLIGEAVKMNLVKEDDLASLEAWKSNPASWG